MLPPCNARIIRMAHFAKEIKRAAHIDILLLCHIEQRQVHSAAAAVSGMLGNVVLRNDVLLVQLRIEIRFHPDIRRIFRPAHEVIHAFLRTVSIENLQPKPLLHCFIADCLQRFRCFPGQQSNRFLISIDPLPDEIERGIIPDIQQHIRDYIPDALPSLSYPG